MKSSDLDFMIQVIAEFLSSSDVCLVFLANEPSYNHEINEMKLFLKWITNNCYLFSLQKWITLRETQARNHLRFADCRMLSLLL